MPHLGAANRRSLSTPPIDTCMLSSPVFRATANASGPPARPSDESQALDPGSVLAPLVASRRTGWRCHGGTCSVRRGTSEQEALAVHRFAVLHPKEVAGDVGHILSAESRARRIPAIGGSPSSGIRAASSVLANLMDCAGHSRRE